MPADERGRLEALADYRVLDTPPEPAFDNITGLASSIFHTPIALVSLVDEHRQWFKSRVGLDVAETPREISFCDHAIRADATLVVEDATRDPRFVDNPLVVGEPHVRFYCGVVLRTPEGHGLGTLCLIDRVARTISRPERTMLEALGRQVESELELRRRLLLLEDGLQEQRRHQGEQQLLASMLVHDLRGPLTSVSLLATALVTEDEQSRRDLEDMQAELMRARRMLTDVLDICLGQLGELRPRRARLDLVGLVEAVARRVAPRGRQRGQRLDRELPASPLLLDADPDLVERVLDNLLTNAMEHGPAERPVTVAARRVEGGRVRLEVRDEGEPVPAAARETIFRPFDSRPGDGAGQGHVGLGLAFCGLAARAHGGRIGVEAGADRGNCFYVEIPDGV